MKCKLLDKDGEKSYAVVFDTGDEVASGLLDIARQQNLAAARFTAIGACSKVTLGYFELARQDYKHIPLDEQVEVLSLVGDIALTDGQPMVHAHLVVGTSDGAARGGHLIEANVRPTLEVMLVEAPAHLQRVYDPQTGIALIRV